MIALERKAFACGLALWAAGLGVGCARGSGSEAKSVSSLKETVGRVQADQDRLDQRLAALEIQAVEGATKAAPVTAAPPPASDAVSPSAASFPTPRLRVVRLSPEGGSAGDEPSEGSVVDAFDAVERDAPDERPAKVIRLHGNPAAHGGAPPSEGTPASASAGEDRAPRASVLDARAKRAYDEALALVRAHRYPEALEAFAGFLVRWPDHPYAENATYWRGECYFAQGDHRRAAEQFEGALVRASTGVKAPDALLKLAMCHERLGDKARAKTYAERLRREYAQSEAVQKIPSSL